MHNYQQELVLRLLTKILDWTQEIAGKFQRKRSGFSSDFTVKYFLLPLKFTSNVLSPVHISGPWSLGPCFILVPHCAWKPGLEDKADKDVCYPNLPHHLNLTDVDPQQTLCRVP